MSLIWRFIIDGKLSSIRKVFGRIRHVASFPNQPSQPINVPLRYGARLQGLPVESTLLYIVPIQTCRFRYASRLAYYEFGVPSEVLKFETFEDPSINDDKGGMDEDPLYAKKGTTDKYNVIVKMLAVPVHPSHINIIQGTYPLGPKSFPAIGGAEGIGQVIEVGNAVDRLKVGDLVYPARLSAGTWTTHIKENETNFDKVTLKVALEADKEANQNMFNLLPALSVLRVNPGTALRMLKDFVPDMKSGDVVIQNGANSAVGQAVIQVAKTMGLVTVNVVRDRDNIDELKGELKKMGADFVWTEQELRASKEFRDNVLPKARLALNCVGGSSSTELSKCLGKGGVHVTYGGMSLKPVTAATSSLIFKDISFRGFWMSRWAGEYSGSTELRDMYLQLESMLLSGQLTAPKYQLVPFHNQTARDYVFKQALKGFNQGKYIFDMRN